MTLSAQNIGIALLLLNVAAAVLLHRTLLRDTGHVRNKGFWDVFAFVSVVLALLLVLVGLVFSDSLSGLLSIASVLWIIMSITLTVKFKKHPRLIQNIPVDVHIPNIMDIATVSNKGTNRPKASTANQTSKADRSTIANEDLIPDAADALADADPLSGSDAENCGHSNRTDVRPADLRALLEKKKKAAAHKHAHMKKETQQTVNKTLH